MTLIQKINLKFIIFVLVGIFNTLLDLVLYLIFYEKTRSIIVSNLIATSVAMISSYFLNARLTFKKDKLSLKKFILFILITAFGLWILQTGFILLITPIINNISSSFFHLFGSHVDLIRAGLSKVLAIAVSFLWNFIWYDKVIFKNNDNVNKITQSLE